MKTALFHNFTDTEFIGFWDGKAHHFKPGEQKYMPEYLASHFAKHLANSVLIAKGGKNETYTSPKFPEQVPAFKELFDKACIVTKDANEQDEMETQIDIANRGNLPPNIRSESPQIIHAPDENEDDGADFEGLKDKK
jgi:hypothetical protein